jgi:uncharacterized protein YabN with tetrapyrrole methylase and pyrophosphatase domain
LQTGSLTVVGTGFGGGGGQVTAEAGDAIASAEKVLYLTPDASSDEWIRAANPTSESLGDFYLGRASRLESYLDITEHILSFVRRGLRVCAVFYGHPGVLVFPSHEAIIRARDEGFAARMLPGVSAEDCLFSDLGVDPGRRGCLTFEATDFMIRRRRPDATIPMVLWQVGAVGRVDYPNDGNRANIALLADVLQQHYGARHEVIIYQAATAPGADPVIKFVELQHLADAPIRLISTLYVPPRDEREVDRDMVTRLGMPEDVLDSKDAVSRYHPFLGSVRPESHPPQGS